MLFRALTFAGFLGRCWLRPRFSTLPQRMLMHGNTCLIPILKFSCRIMRRASLHLLQLISWYLLPISFGLSADSNTTCEVICLRVTPPARWNQLPCCPESFLLRQAGSSNDDLTVLRNPAAADGSPDSMSSVDDGTIDSMPSVDDGILDSMPSVEDGVPDSMSLVEDGIPDSMPSVDDGSPDSMSSVDDGSPDFMPSIRERRSLSRERRVHAIKQRSPVVQTSLNASCMYPFVHSEPLLQEFQEIAESNAFRVIHSCQRKYIGSELHSKCLDFRNASSLESVVPVVDGKTRTIHANRFCAECSGIQDFEAFQHKFVCSNEILGHWEFLSLERTQENQPTLIKSGLCVYSLQPPDNETLNIVENRCLSAKYTDCNEAGDAMVLGKSSWHDFAHSMFIQGGYYCAFCGDQHDKPRVSDIEQSANKSVQTTCNGEYPNPPRQNVMSFSFFILMSLDKALITTSDDRVTESHDMKCGNQSYDVYDKFMV